ncbi:uncharacterized protein B0H18DRAFT_1085424 [Fomitopsis serialis]|uniref:uncharacterized protein n=1 Tax=Fomitopsis serialis TaxID=139415 RepID=UPI0020071F88|nr:uncharacterized protein B0H18DRAFT_1085424 [Neoantrodia serialis]KAH9924753.1 hypothetical protein B0H18DRAFT_1085424 [Neoantrodia serialis]
MSPISPTSEQVESLFLLLWLIHHWWHEFCHIVAVSIIGLTSIALHLIAVLSLGCVHRWQCHKVTIDPDIGGATRVEGGRPLAILAAGYVGSTILGGVFVLAGFDILMSKILSFVLASASLPRSHLTILLTSIYEGLLVGFWFIDHGQALRWYSWAAIWILFEIGVLIGFVFLGIVAFKRTNEQMYQEAGAML